MARAYNNMACKKGYTKNDSIKKITKLDVRRISFGYIAIFLIWFTSERLRDLMIGNLLKYLRNWKTAKKQNEIKKEEKRRKKLHTMH